VASAGHPAQAVTAAPCTTARWPAAKGDRGGRTSLRQGPRGGHRQRELAAEAEPEVAGNVEKDGATERTGGGNLQWRGLNGYKERRKKKENGREKEKEREK